MLAHRNPVRLELLLSPFYRCENEGPEALTKVAWQGWDLNQEVCSASSTTTSHCFPETNEMISSLPARFLIHLPYGVTVSTRLCAFWLWPPPLLPDTCSNKPGASPYPSFLLGVLPSPPAFHWNWTLPGGYCLLCRLLQWEMFVFSSLRVRSSPRWPHPDPHHPRPSV